MMNVANQVSLVKNPQLEGNGLKVGDFVFVRVLKKLENNKAVISFGGQSFEALIDDKNHLLSKYPSGNINGGFRAKILQENNQILLHIFEKSEIVENQNIIKNSIHNFTNQNEIKNYLLNLGLIPDEVSYKIIQFIQQMGYYFDGKKIENIRKIVLQFPGNEKKASEAAIYLEEKGLPVTKDSIQDFMEKIQGLRSFDNNFLAKSNSSKKSGKYWICLPFEYVINNQNTTGTIFLLKEESGNFVSQINIRLFSLDKNFLFRIYLKNPHNQGKIFLSKILFYVYPLESEKIKSLTLDLEKLFENQFLNKNEFSIQFSEDLKDSLFFSDDMGLISVNTNA